MSRLFLSLMWFLALYSLSFAGEWTVKDKHTLRFEGHIERNDIPKFNELVSKDIKTIIVNCGGGDVLAAIPIAERIQSQKIDIIVDGICASSCANYFFIAANNKKVPKGSLFLLHGGITPMLEHKDQMVEYITKAGGTPEQIESYLKAWYDGAKKERDIYEKAGVDISLLEYSYRATNGKYDFWAPPLATLKKLGVKNIIEFWYPTSDEEMNALSNKLRNEYAKKYTIHSSHLNIMGGDIDQYKPEHKSTPLKK